MVASRLLTAFPAAVGARVVINGGQYVAQLSEHVDFDRLSDANMYSALPEPSVRNVPIDPLSVATVAAADVPAFVPPPAEVPDFVELLQAAITSTAAVISAPMRHNRTGTGGGMRLTTVISFNPATIAGILKAPSVKPRTCRRRGSTTRPDGSEATDRRRTRTPRGWTLHRH